MDVVKPMQVHTLTRFIPLLFTMIYVHLSAANTSERRGITSMIFLGEIRM